MKVEVFTSSPDDFEPKLEVVSCFIEAEKKILILKRSPGTFEEGLWCLPGGKINEKETPKEGVIREVLEETGLFLSPLDLEKIGIFFIRKNNFEYLLHVFSIELPRTSEPLLDMEHEESKWLTTKEALEMPLISSGKKIVEYFIEHKKEHSKQN